MNFISVLLAKYCALPQSDARFPCVLGFRCARFPVFPGLLGWSFGFEADQAALAKRPVMDKKLFTAVMSSRAIPCARVTSLEGIYYAFLDLEMSGHSLPFVEVERARSTYPWYPRWARLMALIHATVSSSYLCATAALSSSASLCTLAPLAGVKAGVRRLWAQRCSANAAVPTSSN